MSAKPRILGQSKPAALTTVTLFTVDTDTTVEFSIFINNQSTQYDGYTITLIPQGTLASAARELAYNTQLAGGTTNAFSGLYLNSGDSVTASSSLGNCAFMATGIVFS
jgi:hypothetical protein